MGTDHLTYQEHAACLETRFPSSHTLPVSPAQGCPSLWTGTGGALGWELEAQVVAQALPLADWVSLSRSLPLSGLGIFIYKLEIMTALLPALSFVLERLCMQVFDGN